MSKSKFKFDPESLQYDNVDPKGRKKIIKAIVTQIIAAIVFSVVFYMGFIYFFGTTEEKNLQRENEILEEQYKILSERFEQTDTVLKDLKQRDANIYRAIFETEPPVEDSSITIEDFEEIGDLDLVNSNNELLTKLKIKLFEQDKTFENVKEKLSDKKDELRNIPSIQPLPNSDLKLVPYGYGNRIDPVYKTPSFHNGIDFAAPKGTEIYATADGTVKAADENIRGYGMHIKIDHGNGYETIYAHLSEYAVYVGKKVSRGDIIGYVGNTGKSLVSHLHYEVYYEGKPVNPVNFFFQDLMPSQFNQLVTAASRSGLCLD